MLPDSLGPTQSPSYYLQKCREHVHRGVLSFQLSIRGLTTVGKEDVRRELGPESTRHTRDKLREVLVHSHFFLAKANFELFLHLFAVSAWRVALHERRPDKPLGDAAEKRLRETSLPAAMIVGHPDSTEAICSLLVPRHGLEHLRHVLRDVDIEARALWDKSDQKIFAQIHTAFAVRYLIEERNGKVDQVFRAAVESTWEATSWGARGPIPESYIDIVEADLLETEKGMLKALEAMEPTALNLDARYTRASSAP